MTKFTLTKDHSGPVTIAVDQVNARFVDETMRGTYEYPAIKLILTKVRSSENPKTQVVATMQQYLSGNRDADTHVSCAISKGLKQGDYVLLYQAEFTNENPERKLVVSVYCGEQIKLQRVATDDYSQENFDQLDLALYEAVTAQQEDIDDY